MASRFKPYSCYAENGCLKTGEGELLANCEPRVLCKTVLLHPRTGEQIRIDVELSFVLTREGKERHISHTVDMSKLDKMKLSEIDADLYTASDKNFVAYIKSLVPEAPTEEKYSIDSLGWVNINGHYFYNIGIFENNGRLRQYKPNRKRYLVLKKKALRDNAKNNSDLFDELFG